MYQIMYTISNNRDNSIRENVLSVSETDNN